jgi:spore maturation protein SpmA
VLNGVIVTIFVASILLAAWTGNMTGLTDAILASAKSAVTLALGLIGAMAFFLGMMRVAQDGGLLHVIARALGPLLRLLFPKIPADHPAMSAMILNMGSNMLGLGNAATPFGIKAIEEMDKLNGEKGTATNAMVLFLTINTSALALLPSGMISLRLSAGSQDATGIFLTTWFASGCATVVAITAALLLGRLPRFRATEPPTLEPAAASATAGPEDAVPEVTGPARPPIGWRVGVALALGVAFVVAFGWRVFDLAVVGEASLVDLLRNEISFWILPFLIGGMALFGWTRAVPVYESWVEGAKEGFQVAIRIIPYLVVILVAVGMFRASGGIDLLASWVGPITGRIGMPAETIPIALVRPLSGTGAMGVVTEVMAANGPDSLIGYMASTMSGSTDTTFYILAVYFGAVGVKRTRHALPACLLADTAGILASVFIVNLLYG